LLRLSLQLSLKHNEIVPVHSRHELLTFVIQCPTGLEQGFKK